MGNDVAEFFRENAPAPRCWACRVEGEPLRKFLAGVRSEVEAGKQSQPSAAALWEWCRNKYGYPHSVVTFRNHLRHHEEGFPVRGR